MAGNDIGVTFIPSEANQIAQGQRQGSAEGDLSTGRSSDLGQAFKILSLQLPRVVSAAAPTAPDLLTAPGARTSPPVARVPPAGGIPINGQPNVTQPYDPMAAVFAALLRSLQGGSAANVGGTDLLGGLLGAGTDPGLGRTKIQLGEGGTAPPTAAPPAIPPGATNDWPMPTGTTMAQPSATVTDVSAAPSGPVQQDYQSWAGSY